MRFIGFAFAIGMAALAAPALAAEKCYDYRTVVDETMACDANYGGASGMASAADFAGNCTASRTEVVAVEIECPPKGKWVNVTQTGRANGKNDTYPSQSKVCASVGMSAAKLDGKMCASGERRPSTGGDWEYINYGFGTKGSRAEGGERQKNQEGYVCEGGGDNGSCGPEYFAYCYHNSGTTNNTGPDKLVAYYCE